MMKSSYSLDTEFIITCLRISLCDDRYAIRIQVQYRYTVLYGHLQNWQMSLSLFVKLRYYLSYCGIMIIFTLKLFYYLL